MAMFSRNKGLFSLEFLVPNVGLLFAVLLVEGLFATYVRPRAAEIQITQRLVAAQSKGTPQPPDRSLAIIIKDPEQEVELMLWLWATIILTYKLVQVGRERSLLKHDFIDARQGERIIPEDALDRYKELKAAVEATPRWRDRLLPDFVLAALHRFHATNSVQDAASAIKERAELVADNLDSSLSLLRYVAWAIPAVGFIGTVRGIGDALGEAHKAVTGDVSGVTEGLGVAFNSTLIALLISIVLMFLLHQLQLAQERLVLDSETYLDQHLIRHLQVR